jgi:translation initiation factor IF-3
MAQDAGLDLVEVAPQSKPPVCRILDYGKFKYEEKKRKKSKPKTTAAAMKEVRVRPKIDVNDLKIKVRKATEFLEAGSKVQVTCLFRGREMAYKDRGRDVLMRVVEALADIAKVEREPRMAGRRMTMMLGPLSAQQLKLIKKKPVESPAASSTKGLAVVQSPDDMNLPVIESPVAMEQPLESDAAEAADADAPVVDFDDNPEQSPDESSDEE